MILLLIILSFFHDFRTASPSLNSYKTRFFSDNWQIGMTGSRTNFSISNEHQSPNYPVI
jgi:hypothetical protein